MPRIAAPSVAEHAARQQQRVFDEAIRLFLERGYQNVSFADVAAAVGLARSSLYRYYPSKADILSRWFRIELEERIQRSTELLASPGNALELIIGWADDQLDYAARSEHELMMSMAQVEPTLAAEARSELFGIHSRLLAPLAAALARAGVADDALAVTGELVSGLVLSAARYESVHGSPDRIVRDRLHWAVTALVDT